MKLYIWYLMAVFGFIHIIHAADYSTVRHHRASTNRSLSGNDCQKLYDRVVTLATLDEQQIRQLETMDSRLTRMELTTEERFNMMRDELKVINKQTEAADWVNTKTKATLDELLINFTQIRQRLDDSHLRPMRQIRWGRDEKETVFETNQNVTAMLSSLATFLASVRQGVFNVEEEFKLLKTNVSTLLQISRELQKKQHSLPNKTYINHAINQVRSQLCNQPGLTTLNNRGVTTTELPSSCNDKQIKENQINKIEINQNQIGSFYVKCFSNDDYGKGWTIILNRYDGSINFYRNWLEYKFGFGNIAGEFFIGLEKLHALTSSKLHELIVLLQDFNGEATYAKFNAFSIAGEKEEYALNILGDYEGTAGDSLRYSASYKFSTFDNDNDGWVEGNCAQSHTGGWWYNACEMSNLMGQYLSGEVEDHNAFRGMYWNEFKGSNYSLYAVRMMIRPIENLNDNE